MLSDETQAASAPIPDQVADLARAAGDPLRARIMQVLAQESFAVSELSQIFEVPQPALSHHLRVLADAGLVGKRKEGTSIFYHRPSYVDRPLIRAFFSELDTGEINGAVAKRRDEIYQARLARSSEFFAKNQTALEKQQTLICPADVYTPSIIDVIDQFGERGGTALEVGPGDGDLLSALADRFDQVIGIERSVQMYDHIHQNIADQRIALIHGDVLTQALPPLNLAVAAMVIHHLAAPHRFFARIVDALEPGGLLIISELKTHAHDWAREHCGDVWLGFEPEDLAGWAREAGLEPLHQQFLTQRNGFTIQVLSFLKPHSSGATHQ